MNTEAKLQIAIANFIRLQYPKVYFMSDHSGVWFKSFPMRKFMKDSHSTHAQLDMVILHPNKGRHGLILELKSKSPLKKDGSFKKDAHLQDQQNSIVHLTKLSYSCGIVWELNTAIEYINEYMK